MRTLASVALNRWGVEEARYSLLRQAGNTLFRVQTSDLPSSSVSGDLFAEDNFLLRIHEPGYQEPQAIGLELSWLSAMRREANLPVQEPMPTPEGKYLLSIEIPEVPGARNCSILRWIKGNSVKNRFCPHHFEAQGRLMARLHNFSLQWQPPSAVTKRKFDWEGLFQNDVGSGMPNANAWALLSDRNRSAFAVVANQLKVVMDEWGQDSSHFGLIHGDLGVDSNLLFWHGEPRVVDFDDSGFGYWIYDLAVALDAVRDDPEYALYRAALLRGYAEYRELLRDQVDKLDLFLAGVEVYWNLWATGGTHLFPDYLPEFQERINRTAEYVVRFVQSTT